MTNLPFTPAQVCFTADVAIAVTPTFLLQTHPEGETLEISAGNIAGVKGLGRVSRKIIHIVEKKILKVDGVVTL